MPIQRSHDPTSDDVPAVANSVDGSHTRNETRADAPVVPQSDDADASLPTTPSLTPFPCLTGWRPRPRGLHTQTFLVEIGLRCSDLQIAAASAEAAPIAAIQAAWSAVLSAYTASQDAVAFITATDLAASHEAQHSGHIAPFTTSWVHLGASEKERQHTCSSTLAYFVNHNHTAQRTGKDANDLSARSRHRGEFGSSIALNTLNCLQCDQAAQTSVDELLESECIAVGLIILPGSKSLLQVRAKYNDRYLNDAGASILVRQFEDVLKFIIATPAEPLLNSTTAVRSSLLSTSNERPEEISGAQSPHLQAQFEELALRDPNRIALDFLVNFESDSAGNTRWTFSQLNEKAETFARYIVERFGQMHDEIIPICMERRPELYVAILGTLKAGAAWCPIDPSFPPRRRHDLIARTGSRILIVADRMLAFKVEDIPSGVEVVDMMRIKENWTDRLQKLSAKIGSLAYLIWTSGTTGEPKGVPISHEAAVTSMRALQNAIPTDVADGVVRCLQFSQFTFDVFVQDLFYTWGVGGTIISSTRGIMLGSFADLATKTKATHCHLTPAFAASVPRERCPTLEVVTMIGEKLSQAVADDWSKDMRAYNTYGPAEATVVSTLRRFGAPEDEVRSGNIGFPLPSVSCFVMRNGHLLMRQGVGELALGGPQLSKGYWKDSERSSGRFVWNEQLRTHLYITGDVVRQLYDGSLEFLGRTDDLIKIQGIRVELSEIGFALRSCHELVEQLEVQYLERKDRPTKVVVAFLAAPKLNKKDHHENLNVSDAAVPLAQVALIKAQKNLPGYMIPRVFLVLSSIPRTSSNKTDNVALQGYYDEVDLGAWEGMLFPNQGSSREWSTRDVEVATIVAELSGTSQNSMSRSSDLRSLGIDSIAATRLVPKLNTRGISCSVADVLLCQCLGDLFNILSRKTDIPPRQTFDIQDFHNEWYEKTASFIGRRDVFIAPTLPLQESLLVESMRDANAYWNHTFLSLGTDIEGMRLRDAWNQVVESTEALRTGFIPRAVLIADDEAETASSDSGSTFLQLLYEKASLEWTIINSTDADLPVFANERARIISSTHQEKQFRDPLLAVTIFDKPSGRIIMVSVHHAVRDEVSLDLILEAVERSYKGSGEQEAPSRHLRSAIQVMLPTSDQIKQDHVFWSTMLKDFSTTDNSHEWPDLTGDTQQAQSSASGYITCTHTFDSSYKSMQNAALKIAASSIASVLRIAWGCILLAYLETDRLVFAETWSQRFDNDIIVNVVGPLLTVIPVPFRAVGTVREALNAQADLQWHSREHRSVHARVIRKILGRPEGQGLYPALFNFLPDSGHGITGEESVLWTKIDSLVPLAVEHPIALNVSQTASGALELEIAANQSIMSTSHLSMIAMQLKAFVDVMLQEPDMPLSELSSTFSDDVLSKSSIKFSDKVKNAGKQSPTVWVDYHAAEHPDWLAVHVASSISNEVLETDSWTFAELRSHYEHVAAFISRCRHRNRMIAVCLDRRIESYAVILGVMASGNCYLPIDEDLPSERKLFLLRDSTAAMIFTTRHLAATIGTVPNECRIKYVDDDKFMVQAINGCDEDPYTEPHPKDNAYLLYTSGSTGVPKGVLVGRGNLCSFIEGLSEFIYPLIPGMEDLPGKGRYLGLASRAFDVHLAEMFLPWRRGLAAVTAPRTMLLDDLELALRKLKITHASFVPSLIDQAGLDPANLPDLRYLGVGGEKMSKRVVDLWAGNCNAALINAYGPTELSIGCTAAEVRPGSNMRNVGVPYGNSVAHVLVPGTSTYTLRGIAGELCFTGDLVANGYHNRPDAKGFVEDFHGQRMYRTGDIGRLLADDSIEYLRREDDQTKVRGQRLELGEISESIRSVAKTILATDRVEVATMVAQHPKLSRSQLVNFVVPDPRAAKMLESPVLVTPKEGNIIASKILSEARKVLPAYMVPDVVIPLTSLPLAPQSGKADMKRLKAIFTERPITESFNDETDKGSKSTDRELTESEKNIQSVVASILRVVDTAEIKHNTSIFGLGLDSLSAISVAVKLQRLGYNCNVSNVLSSSCIEQLATLPKRNGIVDKLTQTRSRLAGLESRFRSSGLCDSDKASVHTVRPCLPLQETLVASSINDKGAALYINHLELSLSADLDLDRLYKAWIDTVANNEILRTCFQEFENGFVQIVREYDENRLVRCDTISCRDMATTSHEWQIESVRDIIEKISTVPPIRLALLKPAHGLATAVLSISVHHGLYDAVSLPLVLNEVRKRYDTIEVEARTPFDRMIEYVQSQDPRAAQDFWMRYLADCLPTSIVIEAKSISGGTKSATPPIFERKLRCKLRQLEDLSASLGGTLTSTIQAVFGIVMAQMLAADDVVFGVVLSGRTVPIEDPENICAPCITTIPQRVRISQPSVSIEDVLRSAQQGFVESLEFQHTALRHIHRWIGAERPLFDCLVSYTQKQATGDHASDLWTKVEDSMPSDFPLAIEFEADREAGQMKAHCAYTSAFGDSLRASTLLENIDLLLGALIRGETLTARDLGISTGKADASAMKPVANDNTEWTPMELKMRETVAEVSDTRANDIPKDASFFSLGVDSITAIRLARYLRESGMECSSADVMRYPSIVELARRLSDDARHKRDNDNSSIESSQAFDVHRIIPSIPTLRNTDNVTDVYACTALQSSMLTQTLGSDGRLYSNHHAFTLAPTAEIAMLKATFRDLTSRTEILRTTFHFMSEAKRWVGEVHAEIVVVWTERAIERSFEDEIQTLVQTSSFCEASDFERPPWKVTVLEALAKTVLVISMHHALYDGQSIQLLLKDLTMLYNGQALPMKPQFSDAARVITKREGNAERYWIEKLGKYEGNTEASSPTKEGSRMIEVGRDLNIGMDFVLRTCKELGVTVQTVALLAFAKTLACYVGHRDTVFGQVIGGRSLALPEADDIIGPLFNTVPVRITLDRTYVTNKAAAAEIQRSSGESQLHQHAMLGKIQQAWRQIIGNLDAKLFDALFVFSNVTGMQRSTEEIFKPFDLGGVVAPMEYSTNFEVEQRNDHIVVRISSHDAAMTRHQLADWHENFHGAFQDILEHPGRSVLAFPAPLQGLPLAIEGNGRRSVLERRIEPGEDLDTIGRVLSEVSGVPLNHISLNASIFSLGLDSIAAINVASSCRNQSLGVTVADVLQGQSLRGICERLRGKRPEMNDGEENHSLQICADSRAKALSLASVDGEAVEDILPCLAGQVYHLMLWKKSDRTMCEAVFAYSCTERVEEDRMRSAWRALRKRHPILRTIFVAVSAGKILQLVLKPSAQGDSFETREALGERAGEVEAQIRQDVQAPFDLAVPPAALYLLRRNEGDVILLKLHHASYDAWTVQTMLRDLASFYRGQSLLSIPNYPSCVMNMNISSLGDAVKTYWRKSLQGFQQTLLTAPNVNQESKRSIFIWVELAIDRLQHLNDICYGHSTTLTTVTLVAFAGVIAKKSGTRNPCFGLYRASRSSTIESTNETCLPTLNVSPFMVPNVLDSSIAHSVQHVQNDLADRVQFEQCHLRDVLAMVGHGGRPLFNTFVNILSRETRTERASVEEGSFVPCDFELPPVRPPSAETCGNGMTTLDALDTAYLAGANLYLDVSRNAGHDCVDFGIKCDGSLMDEATLREFADDTAREVERIVEELGADAGGKGM